MRVCGGYGGKKNEEKKQEKQMTVVTTKGRGRRKVNGTNEETAEGEDKVD